MNVEVEKSTNVNGAQLKIGVWNIAWGVFLGGCLLCAAGALVYAGFLVLAQTRLDAQVAEEAAAQKADQSIGPEFRKSAEKMIRDIDEEYAASSQGWKTYSAAHAIIGPESAALSGEAKTSRERMAAYAIDGSETQFNLCVEGAIGPSAYGTPRDLKDCRRIWPQADIDKALTSQAAH